MSTCRPPFLRTILTLPVVAALLSGCVTDRSETLSPECDASTDLAGSLIESQGTPDADDPSMSQSLDRLGRAWEESAVLSEPLAALLAQDTLDDDERRAWTAMLDELDELVGARCGFSMRVLVAGSSVETIATSDPVPVDATTDDGRDRPLDWPSVMARVGDAEWLDRGYRGIVGLDPGVYVTVFAVESHDAASTVCEDLLAALADEARTREVVVEVQGLGDHVLVRSNAGTCFSMA